MVNQKEQPLRERDVVLSLCSNTSHHHAGPVRAPAPSEYVCLALILPEGLTGLDERDPYWRSSMCHLSVCVRLCVREKDGPISRVSC